MAEHGAGENPLRRGVAALLGCAVVAATGVTLGTAGTTWASAMTALPGSTSAAVRTTIASGAVPASERLTIQVWLKPSADAAAFADAVSTPGNPQFHHFLSPAAYTARFGPSAARATAVAKWLADSGLGQVHADSGRDYVSATGPVSTVQSALRMRMGWYRVKGASTRIQSNDRDVSVPAALAPDVLGVTGLNTATTHAAGSSAALVKGPGCSQYWGQHVQSFRPAYQGLTAGMLPVCGYSATQLRAAYGANPTDMGKGQTVALTEEDTPDSMFQTLTDYAKSNHLPAPKPAQYREQQVNGGGTCASHADSARRAAPADPQVNDEAQMDSEAVYTMAPGAAQLMVIGSGCNEDQRFLDAAMSVLTGDGKHPSASIVSNSWGFNDMSAQPVHALDLRAAGEGVGMYFSSGDAPGLTVSAQDTYMTVVGGTTLGIGAANNRVFETGWSDDSGFLSDGKWTDQGVNSGSGGGTSDSEAQPAYQRNAVPASMSHITVKGRTFVGRAVPDIAADADLDTGLLTGYIQSPGNGKPGVYRTMVNAGTSLACPLIAGLLADAQQGQPTPFGFLNPLLYRQSGTAALHDILPLTKATPPRDRAAYLPASGTDGPEADIFDSQQPGQTKQVTAKGYDTMTGLGTPNGTAFIAGLRNTAH